MAIQAATAKTGLSIYQQGYDRIDAGIASEDPEVGMLISEAIDKLGAPMAKRMGISLDALKQMTRQLIVSRAREKMAEEDKARKKKMAIAETVGRAQRQEEFGLTQLAEDREAFMKKLTMQYVGAAMSAAGSFIAQGIESGLFKSKPKAAELTTQQKLGEYDDLDAMDMNIDVETGAEMDPRTGLDTYDMENRGDFPGTQQPPIDQNISEPTADPNVDALAQLGTQPKQPAKPLFGSWNPADEEDAVRIALRELRSGGLGVT